MHSMCIRMRGGGRVEEEGERRRVEGWVGGGIKTAYVQGNSEMWKT